MSIENSFGNNNQNKVEKKAEIEVVSADNYLNRTNENPVKEIGLDERLEEWDKNRKRIESTEKNDRVSRQMKEFSDNGLSEEVGYLPLKYKENGMIDDEESEKIYSSNEAEGYFVQSVPVWGEDGNVVGHKYYRGKRETLQEKNEVKTNIELKYEQESDDKWFYEEQQKEKELQEKVKSGEMVYLGELTDDEYIALRKKGVPLSNFEKVVLFDDKKDYIRDKHKIYARISNPA